MKGFIHPHFMKGIANVFIVFCLVTAFQCECEQTEQYVVLELELPVLIRPSSRSISVGDTLWMKVDNPDTLHDYLSNKFYKLPKYKFPVRIALLKLIDSNLYETDQPAAITMFTFDQVVGKVENIGSFSADLVLEYNESAERYGLQIGIIPRETGVFCIRLFLEYGSRGLRLPVVDQKSLVSNPDIFYALGNFGFVMNDGNFHFDLYKENVKTGSILGTEPDFKEKFNTYTFEVK